MNRYFILGTDTHCGKTYVTCQLMKYFQNKGRRTLAIKPVASGCEDVLELERHNGMHNHTICPWQFKTPIAPHLAADLEEQTLSAQLISDFCYSDEFSELDELLIEGAGGLMVPLNANETWLDVLTISQIPVILVVGMRLGCINHALLTAMALTTHHIPCAGWIANCVDQDMLALSANIKTLSDRLPWPRLATVPYGGNMILSTAARCNTRAPCHKDE